MDKDRTGLFSQNFTKAKEGDIPAIVRDAVSQLGLNMKINPSWFKHDPYVIASFDLPIHIPSGGTKDNIDIQSIEPILAYFNISTYPFEAPKVRIDRISFPVDKLPHLNPVFPGEPYSMCLYRGSMDDWYADHSLYDLIKLAMHWLQDASLGKLMKLSEGDRFEETRIDLEQLSGFSSVDYQILVSHINHCWETNPSGGVAYPVSIITRLQVDLEIYQTFTYYVASSYEDYESHVKPLIQNTDQTKNLITPGLLLWADSSKIYSKYFGTLPNTREGLIRLGRELGIDIPSWTISINNEHPDWLKLPNLIYLCIQRPAKLMTQDTNLEILCFMATPENINGDLAVKTLSIQSPLNRKLARNLSNQSKVDNSIMLLGCGALGSKIGLHLGRAGITNLTLVDNKVLATYNLVRHALLPNDTGKNKAVALQEEINKLYPTDSEANKVTSANRDVLSLTSPSEIERTRNQDYIIDATASKSVFSYLIDPHFPQSPTVIRCEIANDGSLGILMVEGHKRSPRLDDLEASLYDLAIDNVRLSRWLVKSEKSQREGLEDGFVNVGVGLGCSSNTLKLADDIVSFHASCQSMLIKKIISDPHFQPGILVSILEGSTATTSHTYFTPVKDYRTLIAGETAGWRFRIKESLIRDLTEKAQGASPNETGGFLIGRINQRSKTVHITRLLDAPKDSVGFPYGFIFGVEDAPQNLKDIWLKTGHQIYYVGEWHSHPAGGKSLSTQDLSAMQQIKKSLDKIGQPTIIMVVTKSGSFPYLFPAD